MMKFIRKYEWYFYLVLTLVIVLSFSFFGTYGAASTPAWWEETAFTTITGRKVSWGELEEMASFLSTDISDRRLTGPYPGPNFLNDGVVSEDFLVSKLAVDLILSNPPSFQKELQEKHKREVGYVPYVHPNTSTISAEALWSYFVPSMTPLLRAQKNESNPFSKEALSARVDLYLIERNLPSQLLRHLLVMQEEKMPWIEKDETLASKELALFGYHRLDDWFGSSFTRQIAAFIINAADLAEKKGYRVSRDEVEARLLQNSEISFKEMKERGFTAHQNSRQYMQEQLSLLRMDFSRAAKIWEKVLLFRRLFHDVRNSSWIENETFAPFLENIALEIKADVLRLPTALAVSDVKELAELETYFEALFVPSKNWIYPSNDLKAIEEIKKATPELVKKLYTLQLKKATDKEIATKITLPQLLSWQKEPAHFKMLQKQFAELGVYEGKDPIAAIDQLAPSIRQRVDRFSRSLMIKDHPEWIEEALNTASIEEKEIAILLRGGKEPLPGVGSELTDRQAFMKLLDEANSSFRFTGKNGEYYEITVLKKPTAFTVVTFEEAKANALLKPILERKLEPLFSKLKAAHADWKNLKDSMQPLLEEVYKPLLDKTSKEVAKRAISSSGRTGEGNADLIASLRFAPFADEVRKDTFGPWVFKEPINQLTDQFLFRKEPEILTQKVLYQLKDENFSPESILALVPGENSSLALPITGKIFFFHLLEKGVDRNSLEPIQRILSVQQILGVDKEREKFLEVLAEILQKESFPVSTKNPRATQE